MTTPPPPRRGAALLARLAGRTPPPADPGAELDYVGDRLVVLLNAKRLRLHAYVTAALARLEAGDEQAATPQSAEEREFAAAVTTAQRDQLGTQPLDRDQRAAFVRGLLARIDAGWVCARGQWQEVVLPDAPATDVRRLKAQQPARRGGLSLGLLAAILTGAIFAVLIGAVLLLP
ncbi:MAG: hypothetical protein M3Z04_17190, partial [Chloroflexota bacterium]|nr:hypothetical protein [Chloroflexota bacterium]